MRYIRDTATGKAAPIEEAAEFKKKYPSGKFRYLDFAEDGTVTPFDPEEVPEPAPKKASKPAAKVEVESWPKKDEEQKD